MNGQEITALENKLWAAADQLRANSKLTATEYSFPVLGLIFLRHAYSRFVSVKDKIEKELPIHPQKGRRALTKDDFQKEKAMYLPEKARWEYLATLPEGKDIGAELDDAMKSIEAEYETLQGVLPKNYSLFEKDLMYRLVRIFNAEELNIAKGDVFGRIYEYFLNNFAKSGAQEGGEFFTPPSLVNTIVIIIEPNHGIFLDPASGSFGMAVQTGHFLEEEGLNPSQKITFYAQEKTDTNIKLSKMNMAVHGLDANILQGNTFYEDQHGLVGKCDFVMANPPFNVDGVDKSKDSVKNDSRLPFGLPNNDNANYLWIQYFYSYLNPTGRSGFVMASSASDAGSSEKLIREKLVKTGAVDVMVSIGTKFFYTRSLPCTLWFFDRAKEKDKERRDKTLMLDLRDVYRKVSSNLHDFTPEHHKNIKSIVGLYRGNNDYFKKTITEYKSEAESSLEEARTLFKTITEKQLKAENLALKVDKHTLQIAELKKSKRELNNAHKELPAEIKTLLQQEAVKKDKSRKERLQEYNKDLELLMAEFNAAADKCIYFDKEHHWLTSRFPKAEYNDVPGLCKVVSQSEIESNDFSLTPGRYVGVAPQIDDGFDYEARLREIHSEFEGLSAEATTLSSRIMENIKGLL